MTTPLFLLRCVELGISVRDLELLTIGLILDMWTEKDNDGIEYRQRPRKGHNNPSVSIALRRASNVIIIVPKGIAIVTKG